MSANTLAVFKIATSRKDESPNCLLPANSNDWSQIRMSRDLTICPNSEYVYATPNRPFVILRQWGSGNCQYGTIVYNIYNFNSLPKQDGRRELFCQNRVPIVLSRYYDQRAFPDSAFMHFPRREVVPNPRLANGIAPTFSYLPIYALVLKTPMFAKMTWGAVDGRRREISRGAISRESSTGGEFRQGRFPNVLRSGGRA